MRRRLSIVVAAAVFIMAGMPALVGAQAIEESFEARAGWSWGPPVQIIGSGGAPAAYLQSVGILDAALPKLSTGEGVQSPFVGDYRAAGVRGVSVTLQIDSVMTPGGRDLSVELTNDGGTPGNVNDDCSAYLVGDENIPLPGTGWKSFVFRIPSQREQLPPDWQLLSVAGNSCSGLSDDEAWNLVMTDVDRLRFSYGDPSRSSTSSSSGRAWRWTTRRSS